MNMLTSTEQRVFNFATQEINPTVKLGDTIAEIIGASIEAGTPVNAIAAEGTLNIPGDVTHGESIRINNPAIAGFDFYEFLADDAQIPADPTHIPVDIHTSSAPSLGDLTVVTQPISGDTMTIGTKVYIFVPVGTDTADGEVSIGADLAGAQAAIVEAINGTDGVNTPHPLVGAYEFAANVSEIYALVNGVAGDTIATTETFDAVGNLFAAGTLANGADCLAADAITALVAAVTAHDTQAVSAVDSAGDTVVFTSKRAGAHGNAITTETAMVSGTFDDPTLLGGVDGTVTDGAKLMADEAYLYVAFMQNDATDANWRRIALGNVF